MVESIEHLTFTVEDPSSIPSMQKNFFLQSVFKHSYINLAHFKTESSWRNGSTRLLANHYSVVLCEILDTLPYFNIYI